MMKTLRFAVRSAFVAIACVSITACADNPPRQTDLDYQSRPAPTAQGTDNASGSSGQRLTIQSGEGEKLILPWFIRDTQDWINDN